MVNFYVNRTECCMLALERGDGDTETTTHPPLATAMITPFLVCELCGNGVRDVPRDTTMQPFLIKAKVIHDQLSSMGAALRSLQLAALIIIKLPPDHDMVSQALWVRHNKAPRL